MSKISDNKIALLIDAENVSEKYIKYILDELSNYGIPTYKRIYGDWSSDAMKRWRKAIMTYSITPIQQFNYTLGKNSSDSALIIDAMDLLYTGNLNGYCIVSSDSDFTRLASRLREAGKMVIGMGEKKTPKSLISACDKFIYLEVLIPDDDKKKLKQKPSKPVKEKDIKVIPAPVEVQTQELIEEKPLGGDIYEIIDTIKTIINELSNEDGLASMADIGNALSRRYPEFDARNYGFIKFSHFMKSLNGFEVIDLKPEGHSSSQMYVKIK
ncbi:MAG: NYN domain-containing protein [Christensenellales bacterium]|jgi:hypothetical protein